MKTKTLQGTKKIKPQDVKTIVDTFKEGGLVVFPTETVYGLGADGTNPKALKKIFKAKGRPGDNPLILHIARRDQLQGIVAEVSKEAEALMDAFWPGPLTLIFKRKATIPDEVTAGLDTVAVRMPSHKVAHEILDAVNRPIAAPSANISGRPSTTTYKRVYEDLNGLVDIIVDGGQADVGIESTVVDTTVTPPMVLRPGKITVEELDDVVPGMTIDETIISKDDGKVPKSPGQKYKHYAPRAEAYCFVGNVNNVIAHINKAIAEHGSEKIAVLATDETMDSYQGAYFLKSMGSRDHLETIAQNLFEYLRECDDEAVDIIFVEGFEMRGLGVSIMNRLLKACGGRVKFGL
ncbi:L-threonylcarbamoyladenylate synthase [Peptoniphilus equinus]|uniref:Threonylcarbamoyl-AMP synthase n=1 Tax=Peptoniphilus equinus TaxID=3016343 RepID=A0ABY7QU06_9FIRM|nr:L-threonylcarbamoyladenylate synthase [Peptoniphilus equinus]WBW50269.1 L-threonylcarbamoyladenylate synthase [Peptoniphilus equinus]